MPAYREKLLEPTLLREFPFNVGNKFLPLLIHLVLRLTERPAFFIVLGFESLDLVLAGELLFERFKGEQIVAKDEAVIEEVAVRDALLGVIRLLRGLRARCAAPGGAGSPSQSKSVPVFVFSTQSCFLI